MVSIWFFVSIVLLLSTIWLAYALYKERAQNLCLARELIEVSGQTVHCKNNLDNSLQELGQHQQLPDKCFFKGYACRESESFRQRKHKLQHNQ